MGRQHILEPTPEEMRTLTRLATDHIVRHIESLPSLPSLATEGGRELAAALVEAAPETGTAPEELLELIFERATPISFTNPGPGFMAYIPGGGLFESALADFIAGAINRYVTVWAAAPGLVQLEANVIRWFCRMIGYPEHSGGFLSSGGSMANFSAIFTARRELLGEDFQNATIYLSKQVHHSILRAATLAGFGESALRIVAVDAERRIDLRELAAAIAEDRARGRRPFLVVGSVGTTNTGAVDDLEALAEIADRERLWLHLDAAYGGFFALTERGRARMAGIERADSITLDPHKGLFLPYGTGCLLVQDNGALKRAHTIQADYMPPMQDSDELVDFCEISPELSRDFRGLRVWLPLEMYGFGAFRAALDEKLDLTEWIAGELRQLDGIEIVAAPQLSVLAFRFAPSGVAEADLNQLNRDLLEQINGRKRVFLTETMLDDRFVIRICILNFRTHRDRLEMCLEDIRDSMRDVAGDSLGRNTQPTPAEDPGASSKPDPRVETIEIRPATQQDAAALSDLAVRTFYETFADQNTPGDMEAHVARSFGVQRLRREIEDPAVITLLALFDATGPPVGYAKLIVGSANDAVPGEEPIELERLYLARDVHGLGVGSQLIEACLAEAARRHCKTIWLGVWERNQHAIDFYRRWGFQQVGTQIFRLGSDDQTDLVLSRAVERETRESARPTQRSLSDQS